MGSGAQLGVLVEGDWGGEVGQVSGLQLNLLVPKEGCNSRWAWGSASYVKEDSPNFTRGLKYVHPHPPTPKDTLKGRRVFERWRIKFCRWGATKNMHIPAPP